MLKPGKRNKRGMKVIGIFSTENETPKEKAERYTVQDRCIGYCIVRSYAGIPQTVIQHPEWVLPQADKSRKQVYEQVCMEMREWVLQFNAASDVKWYKNSGYLASDINHRKSEPSHVEACLLEDADVAVCVWEGQDMAFVVQEIRDCM